mgnify:CR=1 FL=1
MDWSINEKLKVKSISNFCSPTISEKIISRQQIKALSKDGEKPANQTKQKIAIILIIVLTFFLLILFQIFLSSWLEPC